MQKKTYWFHTTCVNSTLALLEPMIETARQITWATFLRHVSIDEIKSMFPGYSWHGEHCDPNTGKPTIGFHIKDDFAVTFYKSKYDGKPCYYLDWSGIEHIFI